jgi:hypothetical protein
MEPGILTAENAESAEQTPRLPPRLARLIHEALREEPEIPFRRTADSRRTQEDVLVSRQERGSSTGTADLPVRRRRLADREVCRHKSVSIFLAAVISRRRVLTSSVGRVKTDKHSRTQTKRDGKDGREPENSLVPAKPGNSCHGSRWRGESSEQRRVARE